jgi:hypothetical protein
MFNPMQFYEFGKSRGVASYLLEIGGVSSTINTAALLADKMLNYPSGTAFSPSNILNFTIVGANIQCFVNANYKIKDNAYANNLSITYYNDYGSCIETGLQSFLVGSGVTMVLKKVYLKNAITIGLGCFTGNGFSSVEEIILPNAIQLANSCFANAESFKSIYIPRVTNIGDTVLSNDVFSFSNKGFKVYAKPSMSTINSGGVEGDLAYAINTLNASVIYVTNFTIPQPVTTLLTGTIYSTAIQLNFTAPTGSSNAIDYYECYADGIIKNNITASGQYITGLTANTSFQITIVAVDVFYNKSVVSNSVSTVTNNTSAFPLTNLVSYYKLDSNSIDSYGTNNGVGTAVAYGIGKVGNAAVFNGTSSKISSVSASFDIFGNSKFSYSFWVKPSAMPASNRFANLVTIQESNTAATRDKSIRLYQNGRVSFYGFDGAVKEAFSASALISINNWYLIIGVYDGTNLNLYLNNALVASISCSSTFNFTNPMLVLSQFASSGTDVYYNGMIDEFSFYNNELNIPQRELIYNNGNGITL